MFTHMASVMYSKIEDEHVWVLENSNAKQGGDDDGDDE